MCSTTSSKSKNNIAGDETFYQSQLNVLLSAVTEQQKQQQHQSQQISGEAGPEECYTCPQCFRTYRRHGTLRRHMRQECGKGKSMVCSVCGHRTKRADHLRQHVRKKHPEIALRSMLYKQRHSIQQQQQENAGAEKSILYEGPCGGGTNAAVPTATARNASQPLPTDIVDLELLDDDDDGAGDDDDGEDCTNNNAVDMLTSIAIDDDDDDSAGAANDLGDRDDDSVMPATAAYYQQQMHQQALKQLQQQYQHQALAAAAAVAVVSAATAAASGTTPPQSLPQIKSEASSTSHNRSGSDATVNRLFNC